MEKITNISIMLSFLGLWLTSIIPENIEIILGFLLIFTFGILHGANDILLVEKLMNPTRTKSFLFIISVYSVSVLLAVLLFYLLPSVALILFIVFSAFHFGEQHWEHQTVNIKKTISYSLYFVYGLLVLFLLLVFNNEEVTKVIFVITKYNLHPKAISTLLWATLVAFFGLTGFLFFNRSVCSVLLVKEVFYLLVLTLIFKVSSLIWGFALYFILWHSIPSLVEQIHFIYGEVKASKVILYIKQAFPYWIISLIGLGGVLFIFEETHIRYAILFSFIAAVTFPHALIITQMMSKKGDKNRGTTET